MIRSISRYLVPVALLCLPLLAEAAPGASLTSMTVAPQDAPKVIAAIDQYMNSALGKQYKGRLVLQAHVADGVDPATHSLVGLYHSAAESETFSKLAQKDPAQTQLLDALVPISKVTFTGRMSTMKSWGDINDTDSVWSVNSFAVTDAQAFMAALNGWLASSAAKKLPGQGHLFQVIAGGATPVTHVISVGYASMAEMETYRDGIAQDPDWLKFQAAMRAAATRVGTSFAQDVKAWGPATVESLTPSP